MISPTIRGPSKNLHEKSREQRLWAENWSNLRQITLRVVFRVGANVGKTLNVKQSAGTGTQYRKQIIKYE